MCYKHSSTRCVIEFVLMCHKTALLLLAGLTHAQQGNYDLTCWVRLGPERGFECVPCYGGQVQNNICSTWNSQTCLATQEECCAQPGAATNLCMDTWDECRGATSFDPSHAITNAQCLLWCQAKDPQFDANCGLESYDYAPTDASDPNNYAPPQIPWDTNKCFTQYGYTGSDCMGSLATYTLTTAGAQACQDACAVNADCCTWTYSFGCNVYRGKLMQDCTDVVVLSNTSTSPEDPDGNLCKIHSIQNSGIANTLECEGTQRCRQKSSSLFGPTVCFPGIDPCYPGNQDVCHSGGNNPLITTVPPPETTVPETTVAADTTTEEELPPC